MLLIKKGDIVAFAMSGMNELRQNHPTKRESQSRQQRRSFSRTISKLPSSLSLTRTCDEGVGLHADRHRDNLQHEQHSILH
eukprot:scaffold1440_cov332-Pavlova_lutheri.AAC.65